MNKEKHEKNPNYPLRRSVAGLGALAVALAATNAISGGSVEREVVSTVESITGLGGPSQQQLEHDPKTEVRVAEGDTVDGIIARVDGTNLNAQTMYALQNFIVKKENSGSYFLQPGEQLKVPEVNGDHQ